MFILLQFLNTTVSDGGWFIETITQLRQISVFTISLDTNHFKLTLAHCMYNMLSHETADPYLTLRVSSLALSKCNILILRAQSYTQELNDKDVTDNVKWNYV